MIFLHTCSPNFSIQHSPRQPHRQTQRQSKQIIIQPGRQNSHMGNGALAQAGDAIRNDLLCLSTIAKSLLTAFSGPP